MKFTNQFNCWFTLSITKRNTQCKGMTAMIGSYSPMVGFEFLMKADFQMEIKIAQTVCKLELTMPILSKPH